MDERLNLAASLYTPGLLGADIGTDHGFLPIALVERGICARMIASDVSEKALQHARDNVRRHHLEDRICLRAADGLAAVEEPVTTLSMTGMGGKLIAELLLAGRERLRGAHLVLSAHTDRHRVREALQTLGYAITAERICRAGGRFYLVWKAIPGAQTLTAEELALGTPLLFEEPPALLAPYLTWRIRVTEDKLAGLRSADTPDAAQLARLCEQIDFMKERMPG